MSVDALATQTFSCLLRHCSIFYFQSKGALWTIIHFVVMLICHKLRTVTIREGYNHEKSSERRIELLDHTYKSLYSARYPSCLVAYTSGPQYMSLN